MWPNPQETVDVITFDEEILNGKLCFLCNDSADDTNLMKFQIPTKTTNK